MGTNYYLKTDICPCCGRAAGDIHIGKSSVGWKFFFQAHRSMGLISKKAWFERLRCLKLTDYIVNEYGNKLLVDDFESFVEAKQKEDRSQVGAGFREYYLDEEGYNFSDCDFS